MLAPGPHSGELPVVGDALNVILCGAGHNMRKILAHLRALLRLIMGEPREAIQSLIARLEAKETPQQALSAA